MVIKILLHYVLPCISRVNHSCRLKSQFLYIYYDKTVRVRVVLLAHGISSQSKTSALSAPSFMILIPKLLPSDPKKSCNIGNQSFCAQCGITDIREGPSSTVIEFKMIDRFMRMNWGIICPVECCCKVVLEFVKEGK